MGGGNLFSKPAAAGDNLLFLRLRWILFLWIGVDLGLHYDLEPWRLYSGGVLALLFAASQFWLWRLPAKWLKGLQIFTAIFLLDLFFTVAVLFLMDQADQRLLVVLFLTLFITALVQKLSLTLLISGMVMAIYMALRLQSHENVAWSDTRELLDLPFLVIISLHAAIIVSEARFHEEIRDSLEFDNNTLSKKLGLTSRELKDRVRFVMGAFDAVPAAVVVLDPTGCVRAFNTHAEKLFNAKRQYVLDRPIGELPFLGLLREELKRREGREKYAGAWLKPTKGEPFYAFVRNGIARDEEGALLNMAVFVSPTDPPEEAPTYDAYLVQQKALEQEILQDSAPSAPSAGSGQASVAMHEEAEGAVSASAPTTSAGSGQVPKPKGPAGSTSSGVIQRTIAADVTTEKP